MQQYKLSPFTTAENAVHETLGSGFGPCSQEDRSSFSPSIFAKDYVSGPASNGVLEKGISKVLHVVGWGVPDCEVKDALYQLDLQLLWG